MNALATTIAVKVKEGDISLAENWEGGVAPGASDTADFAVDNCYGPYTMSTDMTFWRFNSGGWGRFTDNPQVFDLLGNTMTLADNTDYAFAPCNNGPRNHMEFYNGKIAFSNDGSITVGYNKDSYSGEWLKLSDIEMTAVKQIVVGGGGGGNFNCELRMENGTSVAVTDMVALSPYGNSNVAEGDNRLIVDGGSSLDVSAQFNVGGGSLLEVTDGSRVSGSTLYSGTTAGACRMLISNATVSCSWAYESGYSTDCAEDFTEVDGPTAVLSAGRLRSGNSSARTTVLAHGGATLEGTAATCVGNGGPATVTVSNANLKAHELLVGSAAGATQSKLRILGGDSSLAITYDGYGQRHDFFGAGGQSSIEIGQGANLSPWEEGRDRVDIVLGTASAGNVLEVAGVGTVYNAPWEYLDVGTVDYDGNEVRVLDGAVYTVRRLSIEGKNTFKMSDATVNIGHGDGYHTSLSAFAGSRLVIAGARPKINFTEPSGNGGVKIYPGATIAFELPETPYAETPIEAFWLNLTYDDNKEIGQIDIDVSKIPADHDRLNYKLASVVETQWLHQDAIDRVNNLESVKAVKGRLAWKGNDLVFTVLGTRGTTVIFR